jgi:hypothetical protein
LVSQRGQSVPRHFPSARKKVQRESCRSPAQTPVCSAAKCLLAGRQAPTLRVREGKRTLHFAQERRGQQPKDRFCHLCRIRRTARNSQVGSVRLGQRPQLIRARSEPLRDLSRWAVPSAAPRSRPARRERNTSPQREEFAAQPPTARLSPRRPQLKDRREPQW